MIGLKQNAEYEELGAKARTIGGTELEYSIEITQDGVLDGEGYKIIGLKITGTSSSNNRGLFGTTTGTNVVIMNLGIINANINVGYNTGTIERAYCIGKITGTTIGNKVGPVIGYNEGTLNNLYWDMTTSNITTGNYGIGKATSEMYGSQLSDFDFTNTWQPNENSYPTLR